MTGSNTATAEPASRRTARPPGTQRVLACALCQQRKVKCSRTLPCTNCVRVGASCVPAALVPRRRRRRYPERDLLDRLRLYESLLRKSKVPFTSLFQREDGGEDGEDGGDGNEEDAGSDSGGPSRDKSVARDTDRSKSHDVDDEMPDTSRERPDKQSNKHAVRPVHQMAEHYKFKSFFWTAIKQFGSNRGSEDGHDDDDDDDRRSSDDDIPPITVAACDKWAQASRLFLRSGPETTTAGMAMLHPAPAQLFRLWQVYLDNVDPLLKVTHTPTLQPRIVVAAGQLASQRALDPTLEALLFGIYCIAVHSMTAAACASSFGTTKAELLAAYHGACEQALLNARLLHTRDREVLTAFLLYLMTLTVSFYSGALYPLLGIAARIGQRMQLDTEMPAGTFSPLETELRRRLWWALALLDGRVGELTSFRPVCFEPTWTCRPPANVHDSALRAELKEAPPAGEGLSEALFAVVRSEVGDGIRRAPYFLALAAPALLPLWPRGEEDKDNNTVGVLDALEARIERTYLRHCDPSNALHYMTLWTVRSQLSKFRLVELFTQGGGGGGGGGERGGRGGGGGNDDDDDDTAARRRALADALRMLKSDTHIMGSPLTRGFRWMAEIHFPLPAYAHVTHELAARLDGPLAAEAWERMAANYAVRVGYYEHGKQQLTKLLARLVLPAWEAYAARRGGTGTGEGEGEGEGEGRDNDNVPTPRIVTMLRQQLAEADAATNAKATAAASTTASSGHDATPTAADSSLYQLTPASSSSLAEVSLVPADLYGGGPGGWPMGPPPSTLVPTDASSGALSSSDFPGGPPLLADPGLAVAPAPVPLGPDLWAWRPPGAGAWTWGPRWGGNM